MPVPPATATLLRHLPLLQSMPDEDLRLLASRTRRVGLLRDAVLFVEGDEGDSAYVVESGQIHLVFESLEGNQLLVHSVGPLQYFGEMALLDSKPRTATAIASVDTELVTISRADFLSALNSQPEMLLNLLRALVGHLRKADETIKLFGFADVASRLAHTLAQLDDPPGRRSAIRVRHDELAAMVGSTRQTVSTILGTWREAGYVSTGRGKLVVIDREALSDMAAL